MFRIVEQRTREPVPNPALEALTTGCPTELAPNTILIDRAGTERPIDDSAAPIRGVDGTVTGAVLVFRNITERRRLEEHLLQARKMEAVGRLAGGIAHDFNNIMTVISGFSELLLAGGLPADTRKEFIRNIHDASQRAAGLTQQILAYSRNQVLMPTVLSLNLVVREMEKMVRRLIGEHIEFVIDTAADLAAVKADPAQIGQIVLNLVTNARDAMPAGGRLTVTTFDAERTEADAKRNLDAKPGRYAVLSVSDTGGGIPPDLLAHIFEPFFTTKGAGKGTGLGLATVHGVVAQSGGHIEVDSRVGAGTTFRVYLPAVDEPPPAPARPSRASAGGTETILLVEDDDTVRRMTRLVLEQAGYGVLEAADGTEAVALANGHPVPIHLLVTDLVMPKLSGREVAERVKAGRPGLRVLYMSGYTEDVIVHQGGESAAADSLHKPFGLDALQAKVREILDRPAK